MKKVLIAALILIPCFLYGATYNATNIKDLDNSTPSEGLSYIPEMNDAIREVKLTLQNSLLGVTEKSANYTILKSDGTIICNAVLDNVTLTLPTALSRTGQEHTIKRYDNGSNSYVCIIATTSGQTIDNASTYTLSANKSVIKVKSDGTNWKITQYPFDTDNATDSAISTHNLDATAHTVIITPLRNSITDNITIINQSLTDNITAMQWRSYMQYP